MEGKTINGYTLQKLLGKGGMAEVWYAENSLGKCAAVKLLLPKLCNDETVVARFQNEAKVMVQLDHPNIRQVYDFGHIDGRPCILMEYLEGDDLKALMKSGKRFKKDELIRWWNQIADALTYTHDKGIVHRDIKPSNIFLDKKGNIKLLDFGIAKIKESISMTQTGAMMGTLLYMSPEQVEDSKHIGPKSDIYSLAVTFVHLLTGKAPYDTTTSNDYVIRKGIVEIPLDLSAVPAEWQGFLQPYLSKKADERPKLRPFEPTELPKEEEKPVANVANEETVIQNAEQPDEKPADKEKKTDKADKKNKNEKHESIENKDEVAKPKKKKSKFWIGLLIGIVAVVVLALVFGEDKDTQAFADCNNIADYRAYISAFGNNSKHYYEAKTIIENHVNDSIEQVKREALAKETALYNTCTTIETCNEYLRKYPNGTYVNQVKTKKRDLEKGLFSVSATKKVYFSKGNLQYQASTKTWRFAEHQWDYIGDANKNISSTYSGWIDLFGWGTSGYNGKYPYMISEKSSDYANGSRNISGTNYDWGVYNTISNGDGKRWRTLTIDEWAHLLYNRKTSSGVRFVLAVVNNVQGVVILPDSWEKSYYTLNRINDRDADCKGNVISYSDWINKLEANGAVFLPAAGIRDMYKSEVNIYSTGESGSYHSSTTLDNDMYSLDFGENYLFIDRGFREHGYSVRLVSDLK